MMVPPLTLQKETWPYMMSIHRGQSAIRFSCGGFEQKMPLVYIHKEIRFLTRQNGEGGYRRRDGIHLSVVRNPSALS